MTPPTTAYDTRKLISKLRAELDEWERKLDSLANRPMAVTARAEAKAQTVRLKRRIALQEHRLRLFDPDDV